MNRGLKCAIWLSVDTDGKFRETVSHYYTDDVFGVSYHYMWVTLFVTTYFWICIIFIVMSNVKIDVIVTVGAFYIQM